MKKPDSKQRLLTVKSTILMITLLCGITAFAASVQVFSVNGAAQNLLAETNATPARLANKKQKAQLPSPTVNGKSRTASPTGTGGDLLFGQSYGGYGRIIKRSFDSPPVENELSGYSDSEPDWSPDGSKIVYTSGRDRGDNSQNREIYLMNADGTNQRRLTFTPADHFNQDPKFSPDGTKIVFTVYDNDDNEIKILNLNDMSVSAITATDDFEFTPEWSPDGSRIIFSDGDSIFTIEPNGMNRTLLLNRLDPVNHPSYSPNGQQIVYSMQESGGENIYVANADGSNPLLVSSAAYGNYSNEPAWSPDGTRIVFVGFRNNDHRIFTVNADGTQETEIVSSDYEFFYNPSWQPTCDSTPIVPGGLVSWWRGEGNADDTAGMNDGIEVGNPSYTAGRFGDTFLFDGADDKVEVPDDDSLDVQTGDYTLAAWVNLQTVNSGSHFIAGKSSFNDQSSSFYIGVNGEHKPFFEIYGADAKEAIIGESPDAIKTDEWYHITMRKEGASFKLFVNGDEKNEQIPGFTFGGSSTPFTIGQLDGTVAPTYTMNGAIDEVLLFNRAISEEEITNLYNLPIKVCTEPAAQVKLKVHYPNPISAGRSTIATLYIPDFAPEGGSTVNLSIIGEAGAITIPSSITIPHGSNEINFTIDAAVTNQNKSVDIVATLGGLSGRATVSIHPAVADLTISNFIAPATIGISQNFTATWRTTNVGQAVTNNAFWADCVLVSPDNEYNDDNNTEIGCFYHETPLGVNESRNVTRTNLQIPPSAIPSNGNYFLFVFTNRNFGVNERELFYINNFISRPIHVSLSPTAASVTIGGRALNGSGNGIYQARISLTGANGATRIVLTNASGYYRFTDLTAGENYVISATHKRYDFTDSTRVLSVIDDLNDVDFIVQH